MTYTVTDADITGLRVDAIVNAANSGLLGGGGVDGAIHRAAGPGLLEECRRIAAERGGCPTGKAAITAGYRLPARFVIHAVGPVWRGGGRGEESLLVSAYRESMALAVSRGLRTVAFPNISTGIYGFPRELAADLVAEFFRSQCFPDVDGITFACFDPVNQGLYRDRFEAL